MLHLLPIVGNFKGKQGAKCVSNSDWRWIFLAGGVLCRHWRSKPIAKRLSAPAAPDGHASTQAQMVAAAGDARNFMSQSDVYQSCLVDYVKAQKDQAVKDKTTFDKSIEADTMKKINANQAEKVKVGSEVNAAIAAAFKSRSPELRPAPANHLSSLAMSEAALATTRQGRKPRPAHISKAQSRSQILEAARRVAARDGARDLSLRAVAAEAGFAPAGLYGYFRSKDELLLALAADDLTQLARAMREAGGLKSAAATALALLGGSETMAAASQALPRGGGGGDAERLFNGRMIAALRALSEVSGLPSDKRQNQCDVVLKAASLAGLGVAGAFRPARRAGFPGDRNSCAAGKSFHPSLMDRRV